MVHRLMHLLEVESAATVVKVSCLYHPFPSLPCGGRSLHASGCLIQAGDSMRDIGEGLNAGCGQTIGVLSGADSRDDLLRAGAHAIADVITNMLLSASHASSPLVSPWRLPS